MLHALLREIDALEAEMAKGVRRTTYQGLPIHVEYDKGDVRSGESREGVKWSRRMRHAYGEILGTLGADGDPLDVYLGPEPYAAFAYVVQAKLPGSATFDEVKIMLGFDSKHAAVKAFRGAYGKPGFFLDVTKWPMGALIEVVRQGHTAQQGRLDERALRAIERMSKAAKRPLGVAYEQPPGSGRWYEVRQVGDRRKRVRVPAPHREVDEDPEGGTRWADASPKPKRGRKPKPKRAPVKHWSGDEDPIEMDADPHEEDTVRLPPHIPYVPPLPRYGKPPKRFREWLADEVGAPPWLRRMAGVSMSKGLRRALWDLAVLEAEVEALAKAARYKPGEVRRRPSDDTYWQKPVGGGKLVQVADMAGTPLGKRKKGGKGERSRRADSARDTSGLVRPVSPIEYSLWEMKTDDFKEAISPREFVEVMRVNADSARMLAHALANLARSRGLVLHRGKWVKATPAAPVGVDMAGTSKKSKAKAAPTPAPEPVPVPSPVATPAPVERIQLPPRRADDIADVQARLSEAAAGAYRGNVQELEERLWAAFREAHSADHAERMYPDTVRALRARLGELGGKEWPVRFEGEAQFSNAGQAYWELQTPGMGEQAIRETLRGRMGIGASPKAYRWLADRLGVDVPDGTAREMQQALVRQLAARG